MRTRRAHDRFDDVGSSNGLAEWHHTCLYGTDDSDPFVPAGPAHGYDAPDAALATDAEPRRVSLR